MSADQLKLSWRETWHENYTMLDHWSKKVDQSRCKKEWKNLWRKHSIEHESDENVDRYNEESLDQSWTSCW